MNHTISPTVFTRASSPSATGSDKDEANRARVSQPISVKFFTCMLAFVLAVFTGIPQSTVYAQTFDKIGATATVEILDVINQFGAAIVSIRYTDDDQLGRKIAALQEPMKVDYKNRKISFYVTEEDLQGLIEFVDSNSQTSLELDSSATQQYIVSPMPRVKSKMAESESVSSMSSTSALPPYSGIPGFSCYRTVEETFQAAQFLASNYPQVAEWIDVGDSWEKLNGFGGFDLSVLKLTNSAIAGPKPKLVLTASVHAREYTPAELATRFAAHLVEGYGLDAEATWILDHHEVHIMLQGNPDGRKQAETGILWRKNTNQNYCGATSNSRGADLNRNFDFQYGGSGSSTNQCSTIYRGAFAASEPETQAIQDYLVAELIDQRPDDLTTPAPADTTGMYLDIHSSGELILPPWGFNPGLAPPNQVEIFAMARKHAFFNGHSVQPSGSVNSGTTKDFGYGRLGVPTYTLELGTEFFEQCSVFENSVLPGNLNTLLYAAKTVRTPYITSTGPDTVNLAVSNTIVPPGTPIDLTAVADDTRYNTSTGTVPVQNVSAAEYYLDVPPWVSGSLAINLNAADGLFNSSTENVAVTIDTTGLADGQHIVYVRAQDTGGTWGAVSAVFLNIDSNAQVPTDLFFDDFESSTGWTTNPSGIDGATTGFWEVANPQQTASGSNVQQLGTTVSGQFDLVTAGSAGTSVGTFDIDNGTTSVRSPDIVIPAGTSNLELSLWYYLAHTSNSSTADFLRITALGDTSSTVIFEELGATNTDVGNWEQLTVNLDAFSGQTINLLIEAADGGNGSIVEAGIDDVRLVGVLPATSNQAPNADAGADQTIVLPGDATLSGSISDDGLPNPPANTSASWSVVSGPGTVTFANVNAASTTASFSSSGTYVLRLTADDGDLTDTDDIQLMVDPAPSNQAPSVNAGTNQTITLPASAALSGSVTDDGLPNPPASVTSVWTVISGPGAVSFSNANALNTTASFSVEGTYVLRLTADDSELSSNGDVQIIVNPAAPSNQAPNVNAGTNQTITLPSSANLTGSISDDGLPNPPANTTATWSVASGPGSVSFADSGAPSTTASFSTSGVYVLRLTANDSALSASDDIQVSVNPAPPVNQAPSTNAGVNLSITLPSLANLNGTVTDDGLPNPPANVTTTWSTVSGPGTVNFGNANAVDSTASFSSSGVYVLRLTSSDSILTSSDDVQVSVAPAPPIGIVTERGIISSVSSSWQTVALNNSYSSMVVVASLVLPNNSSLPAVTRVRNASGNSFDLRVQNPSGGSISGYDVHYIVVEEGVYTAAQDGIKMEAVRATSSQTAQNNNWNARETRSFQNSYSVPVVVGQVMTEANAEWSTFWASSASSRTAPVTGTSFAAGKHVAEDPNATRSAETIGYLVFESGNASLNGDSLFAARSADNIRGTGNTTVGFTAGVSAVTNPTVALVSSNAMDGGDGGWPVLFGATPVSASNIRTAIDEDQQLNNERNHTTEQISYVVFGTP